MLKVPAEGLFASTALRTCVPAVSISSSAPLVDCSFSAYLDALGNDLISEPTLASDCP